MASQSYSFYLPSNKNAGELVQYVETYLSERENMETQVYMPDPNGSVCTVQGRVRGGGFKQLFGLDKAITVRFNVLHGGNTVNVEIGEAKWGDKGAALAVSWFFFWPLAVTSAVGIYQQKQLPQKIINLIQEYLDS